MDDYTNIVSEMRPWASKLVEETYISKYHPVYDAENSNVKAPVHQEVDLIPPTHKHTFAPDIDPSSLIDDEAMFRALAGINWATSDFQLMDKQGAEDEEEAHDDPEASTRQRS